MKGSFLFIAQKLDALKTTVCIIVLITLMIIGLTDSSKHYLFHVCIPLAILIHALITGIVGTMPFTKDELMKTVMTL